MSESAPIPVAGSLSAKVIRACKIHGNTCALDCPEREVVELGELASFDIRKESLHGQSGSQ